MEYVGEGEGYHTKMRRKTRGHIILPLNIYKNATQGCRITNMPL